jgi:alpha-L-fucosidase 2
LLIVKQVFQTKHTHKCLTCIALNVMLTQFASAEQRVNSDAPPSIRLTGSAPAPEHALSLWYRQPGTLNTQLNKANDTLPIGNGRLAAMIQGGVAIEWIQLNEESLWSGGPGGRERSASNPTADSDYNFGYNDLNPDHSEIYNLLKNGAKSGDAGNQGVNPAMLEGNYDGYGKYKNFGFLNLDYMFPPGETEVKGYRRELDMEDGAARVSYQVDGTVYTREYIASYPDNTVAVRIMAKGGSGKVNLRVSVSPGQPDGQINGVIQAPVITADNGAITLSGGLSDNGLLYVGKFKVDQSGGSIRTDTDKATVTVTNADSATIYFSAATDFRNEYVLPKSSERFEKLTYRTGESPIQLARRVASALMRRTMTDRGYAAFRARHQADYKNLFDRLALNLGGANTVPTDDALAAYKAADETRGQQFQMLETLLYQYGRYLLIASSREGSLPANLQGKWNPENMPPWSADYHTNINLQMNYWPAGGANLLETIEPLQKFVESLMVTGRYTAQKYTYPPTTHAAAWKNVGSGWTTHISCGLFGFTAPGRIWYWAWSPAANAFLCQNLYQYLQYGGSRTIFREHYWPVIREAAIMWTKALYKPTDGLWAGKYVVSPSYSPEHGPLSVAVAYDQQLVWELFSFSLDCMKQLGLEQSDSALKMNIEEKLANLYSPVNIGDYGQIMEWGESRTEFDNYDILHRHMSQLVGFYPGTSIANGSENYFNAALETLRLRGDGATGWSMGWKINLWARALDGDHAYKLIQNLFKDNLAQNLFDLHSGIGFSTDGYYFQIDGNFGYTAGVQEMLLQSHLGSLDLLPALPGTWPSGSVQGLRSIGGHELDIAWADGALKNAKIKAFADGAIKVRCATFIGSTVKVNGAVVPLKNGMIAIAVRSGEEYKITLE